MIVLFSEVPVHAIFILNDKWYIKIPKEKETGYFDASSYDQNGVNYVECINVKEDTKVQIPLM